MSIDKIGQRTPPQYTRLKITEGDGVGIPGAQKPALFYQDSSRLPTVSHGEGIYLYDTDGKRYLDGCSGAISANLGHGNKRVIQAATQQLEKVAFAYRKQFENEPANELARTLVSLAPEELSRVFFVNSGSEAVEAAIKLARQYWWSVDKRGKTTIISTRPSYHGATLGALATTDYTPLNIPFRNMTFHVPKVASAFCYHCPLSKEYPDCGIACAHELEQRIQVYGPDNIAAFIVEPIGGSATGGAVPPEEYFPIIERICHEYEVLLIVDDVMMSCGRTGTFYGFDHWDVTPDIVASSKGLSAGYSPIGAIMASDTVVEPVLESGGFMHGHTYAGNPLSAAIALAAVQEIIDQKLVENARTTGTYMHERLHELKDKHPLIGDIRGRGLLAGIEFVQDRTLRQPFPANWYVALEATEIARTHGLLLYPRRSLVGLMGDHVLVAPPLIITEAQVDELIERFDKTIEQLGSLLASHVVSTFADFSDPTVERYQQRADVPDYAIGDIRNVKTQEDANVTAAMEIGHISVDDMSLGQEDEHA